MLLNTGLGKVAAVEPESASWKRMLSPKRTDEPLRSKTASKAGASLWIPAGRGARRFLGKTNRKTPAIYAGV
jgi:hypothetical protein